MHASLISTTAVALSLHLSLTKNDSCVYPRTVNVYSKTCVKRPLKNRHTNILSTNGILMKVISVAECSLGAFCNTFDLHYAIIGNENYFSVFLRVTILHRFYCNCTVYCELFAMLRQCYTALMQITIYYGGD